MVVCIFRNDEAGYLEWCQKHPDGFVVNTRQVRDANYLVLHKASCLRINNDRQPGGFTERSYSKICSTSDSELRAEVAMPFSNVCSRVEDDRR